jgi:Ca-activated chloride channel family protein
MPDKIGLLVEDTAVGLSSTVLFDLPNVYYDDENEVVAMLSLTAPEVDVTLKRPPLNIVAAIDCSTSMSGEKMNNAKSSLKKLVDHLGADDRLAIIGFHSTVFEVLASSVMDGTNKASAHKKIDTLRPNGWTNFSGAMLQAFAEIKKVEGKRGCVNRIILFTDGEPTQGETRPDKLLEMLDKAMIPEVSVSTFGYGKDHDTELLSEMSKRGKGNFFFVEQVDQCAAMFGTELGGLLSTYAQNVRIKYTLSEGVQLVKVLDSAYAVDGNTITMPDVLGGETKHLLIRLKLPKKTRAVTARPSRAIDFDIEYDSVQEARRRKTDDQGLINYVRKKDEVSTTVTPAVQAQLDLVEAANAMQEAKVLADAGDFDAARGILRGFRSRVADHEHVYATALHEDLGDLERGLTREGYSLSRGSLLASSHSYSTRRSSGTARGAMFLNETQNLVSTAFAGDANLTSGSSISAADMADMIPVAPADPPAPARPTRSGRTRR